MGTPEITEQLTFAELLDGRRYELWRTPQVNPGFHIYCYHHGVRISKKPVASELRGRIEFEWKVEDAA